MIESSKKWGQPRGRLTKLIRRESKFLRAYMKPSTQSGVNLERLRSSDTRNEVRSRIVLVLKSELMADTVNGIIENEFDNYYGFEIDSLDRTDLTLALEDEFEINLDFLKIDTAKNLDRIVDLVLIGLNLEPKDDE